MGRTARNVAPEKSPERVEIESLLAQLVVEDGTSECDFWSNDVGHFGHVSYLRTKPGTFVRFTAQGLRSQRAAEVILRDCLKAMVPA